jgi:DNA-binding response OmpR family regulator
MAQQESSDGTSESISVLLVEDEPDLASFITQGLEEENYSVTWAACGEDAIDRADDVDLVLLDVRLPDIPGTGVARRIRAKHDRLPIIMLTALDSVENVVEGLSAGADDYLSKPFAFEELLARMQALLRRASTVPSDTEAIPEKPVLNYDGSRICASGQPIDFTRKEMDLLEYLLKNEGQTVSRQVIHRDVWGNDFNRGTNLIDVYVNYIRKKLSDADCDVRIETVWGIGYRLVGNRKSLRENA